MTILKVTNDYIHRMYPDVSDEDLKPLLTGNIYHFFESVNTRISGEIFDVDLNKDPYKFDVFLTKDELLSSSFYDLSLTEEYSFEPKYPIINLFYGRFFYKTFNYAIISNVQLIIHNRENVELDSSKHIEDIFFNLKDDPSLLDTISNSSGTSVLKEMILNYNILK